MENQNDSGKVKIYAGKDAEGNKSISVHEGMLETYYVFEITKEELYRILNASDVGPILDYYVK